MMRPLSIYKTRAEMVDLNGLTNLIYVDWIPQVNGPPEKSVRSDNRNQIRRNESVLKVESTIT